MAPYSRRCNSVSALTVGQLIEELRRHAPHKPVRVLFINRPDDPTLISTEADVDAVTNEGSYVLLQMAP